MKSEKEKKFNRGIKTEYWDVLSDYSKAHLRDREWADVPRDLKIGIFEWIYRYFEPGNREFDDEFDAKRITELLFKTTGINLNENQILDAMVNCGFAEKNSRFNISYDSRINGVMLV